MSNKFYSFAGFILALFLIKESSCQKTSSATNSLIPLSVGNEWIYRDTVVEDGNIVSVSMDTLRIEKTSSLDNNTTFVLSDGKEIMQRGDTLFQIVSQRGGYKFPTPLFYPSETESSFNYAFGGDVVMRRTVNRNINCPKNEWTITKCYTVKDDCKGETIFMYGLGIYREKITQCASPAKDYTSRTLIKTNFINQSGKK